MTLSYKDMRPLGCGPNTVVRVYSWAPGDIAPKWQSCEVEYGGADVFAPELVGDIATAMAQSEGLDIDVDFWRLWFGLTTVSALLASVIGFDDSQQAPQVEAETLLCTVWPGGATEMHQDVPPRERSAITRGCDAIHARRNAEVVL